MPNLSPFALRWWHAFDLAMLVMVCHLALRIRECCFIRLQRGARDNWMVAKCFAVFTILRVEPALTRIKEDRKRIILPAIDNIKYNTFEVQQYANAAHGYNWGLWCMYIIPPQDWLDKGDESAPIRWTYMLSLCATTSLSAKGQLKLSKAVDFVPG